MLHPYLRAILALAVLVCAPPAIASGGVQPHDVEEFIGVDAFGSVAISADGTYFAATVPREDRTVLVILSRADNQVVSGMDPGRNNHVTSFSWASDTRLLYTIGERFGARDVPRPTGEIYATNADGTGRDLLVGFRAGGGQALGSRISRREAERVSAILVDILPDDPRNVLVSITPWTRAVDPYTTIERMDIHTGRRQVVARAPIQQATFLTDPSGEVRIAQGAAVDNRLKVFYREGRGSEWVELSSIIEDGDGARPFGFSRDGHLIYLQYRMPEGPDLIRALDTRTMEMADVMRGEFGDPVGDDGDLNYLSGRSMAALQSFSGRAIIGAHFMEGMAQTRFFDDTDPDARTLRAFEDSFPGHVARVSSSTWDGRLAILSLDSDTSPTDFFLLDRQRGSADYLFGKRDGIDPRRTARATPISLTARDGLQLHGYLWLPPGQPDRNLPMVVNPHGGPFNIMDNWYFNNETQMLAAAGFAVLQVNFRGSGGYGRAFLRAGFQQWGRAMQDDVTDATRWAIEQGIADPDRICIYGASYGGYAALMGVAREPDLYRCAVGAVGVYDMQMMYSRGDIADRHSGRTYLEERLGRTDLAAISPTRMADRITVPVFLAAGEADDRAPVDHTRAMARALEAAGNPPELMIVRGEGHGFEQRANLEAYYRKLLAFLAEHTAPRDRSRTSAAFNATDTQAAP